MTTVQSNDGTTIAFDRLGDGPAVVIAGGVLGDRSQQAPVAELLADGFTVFNYDRRGHGASGFAEPYAVEREIEDLAAVIGEAGGSAYVYGTSGCGVLTLEAAASGVPITKLAIWEPPYVIDDSRPPVPSDYREQLASLLAAGRRGDMIELFMTQAASIPAEFVAGMRHAPFWAAQEEQAHTLVYDATLMGDFSVPTERLASVGTPTLVIDGGTTPWLSNAANAVAEALPNAQRRTLQGQQHNVSPDAIAPALAEFFRA
jgi:pimeloyl-ACP methyl ester carboxylesterase